MKHKRLFEKYFFFIYNLDKLVKRYSEAPRWLWKKLHIGGVQYFYYFGVHTVRRNDRNIATTNKMKSFYDAINLWNMSFYKIM